MHLCLGLGSGSLVLGSFDPCSSPHGAAPRGSAGLVSGPSYNRFCGTTGVDLESRLIGHASWQSVSTDPHSTGRTPLQLYTEHANGSHFTGWDMRWASRHRRTRPIMVAYTVTIP